MAGKGEKVSDTQRELDKWRSLVLAVYETRSLLTSRRCLINGQYRLSLKNELQSKREKQETSLFCSNYLLLSFKRNMGGEGGANEKLCLSGRQGPFLTSNLKEVIWHEYTGDSFIDSLRLGLFNKSASTVEFGPAYTWMTMKNVREKCGLWREFNFIFLYTGLEKPRKTIYPKKWMRLTRDPNTIRTGYLPIKNVERQI